MTSMRYEAVVEFTASDVKELSLGVGQIVVVSKKEGNGWWYGALAEVDHPLSGWFPSSVLRPVGGSQPRMEELDSPSLGRLGGKKASSPHAPVTMERRSTLFGLSSLRGRKASVSLVAPPDDKQSSPVTSPRQGRIRSASIFSKLRSNSDASQPAAKTGDGSPDKSLRSSGGDSPTLQKPGRSGSLLNKESSDTRRFCGECGTWSEASRPSCASCGAFLVRTAAAPVLDEAEQAVIDARARELGELEPVPTALKSDATSSRQRSTTRRFAKKALDPTAHTPGAPEIPELNPEDILSQGWLTKQGGSVANWKRRWCVLTEQRLYYYVDPKIDGKKPKGDISLLEPFEVVEVETGPEQYLFHLPQSARTWAFKAESAKEMEKWCGQLRKVAKTLGYPLRLGGAAINIGATGGDGGVIGGGGTSIAGAAATAVTSSSTISSPSTVPSSSSSSSSSGSPSTSSATPSVGDPSYGVGIASRLEGKAINWAAVRIPVDLEMLRVNIDGLKNTLVQRKITSLQESIVQASQRLSSGSDGMKRRPSFTHLPDLEGRRTGSQTMSGPTGLLHKTLTSKLGGRRLSSSFRAEKLEEGLNVLDEDVDTTTSGQFSAQEFIPSPTLTRRLSSTPSPSPPPTNVAGSRSSPSATRNGSAELPEAVSLPRPRSETSTSFLSSSKSGIVHSGGGVAAETLVVERVIIVQSCQSLGEKIMDFISLLFSETPAPTTGKLSEISEALLTLDFAVKELPSKQPERWKGVFDRFLNGVLRLVESLQALVRDWSSSVLRLHVRVALDELQSAGYYLKARAQNSLVDASSELVVLETSAACALSMSVLARKLVALNLVDESLCVALYAANEAVQDMRSVAITISPVSHTRQGMALLLRLCGTCSKELSVLRDALNSLNTTAETNVRKCQVSLDRVAELLAALECACRASRSSGQSDVLRASAHLATLCKASRALVNNIYQPAVAASTFSKRVLLASRDWPLESNLTGSAWFDTFKEQQRLFREALAIDKLAQYVAAADVLSDDEADSLTLRCVRLSSALRDFAIEHSSAAQGSGDVSPEACEDLLIAAHNRHQGHQLVALTLRLAFLIEGNLRYLPSAFQRQLFAVSSKASRASLRLLAQVASMDGRHDELSEWQRLDIQSQLQALPFQWKPASDELVAVSREFVEYFDFVVESVQESSENLFAAAQSGSVEQVQAHAHIFALSSPEQGFASLVGDAGLLDCVKLVQDVENAAPLLVAQLHASRVALANALEGKQ